MYQYQLPTSSDKPGTTPAPEQPGDAPADKLSEPGTPGDETPVPGKPGEATPAPSDKPSDPGKPGEVTPAPGKPGEGSTTKPERSKYKTTIGHDDNEFHF